MGNNCAGAREKAEIAKVKGTQYYIQARQKAGEAAVVAKQRAGEAVDKVSVKYAK